MAQKIQKAEERKDGINIVSIVSIVLSLAAIAFAAIVYFNKKEIVYVDSMKLITNFKGAKVAKDAYEKKIAVWKANIDTLTMETNREIAKYEKEKKGMSAREQKLSEELIGTKQQQLESYRQATAENASKEDQLVTGKVFKEINDFLKQYGEQKGYEFIMAATSAGNIVFAKKGNDITDEVLEKMNAEYQSTHK
jgi:outer membrane protein